MSISSGISDLTEIHRLPFDTALSLVVGSITEVQPSMPAAGGSRQMIRISCRGGVPVDVQLFDQGNTIPQALCGGVIRISASPNAARALVWERSKSVKPSMRMGTLVVRRQARLELFRADQAAMAGVETLGYRVARSSQAELPLASAATQRTPPSEQRPPAGHATQEAIDIARSFSECLTAARSALGPDARDDDIRFTAKVTFDELMGRRSHCA